MSKKAWKTVRTAIIVLLAMILLCGCVVSRPPKRINDASLPTPSAYSAQVESIGGAADTASAPAG
ncbi:MAG TPA: hypothetical protein DEB31_03785 [Clostridiales bacterium]|nr:hypothetical protein [Clostridiales bacterium]